MDSENFGIVDQIREMLSRKQQVWVRVRPRKSQPHWSRAKIEGISSRGIIVKPIKHGGRLEVVDPSQVSLWRAMNEKQGDKSI